MNPSPETQEELENLSYFRDIRERRAWMARMTVLIAVLGLLILNVYLMYLSTNAVILNIDLSRLEQSDQFDIVERRMDLLQRELSAVEGAVGSEGLRRRIPVAPVPRTETP